MTESRPTRREFARTLAGLVAAGGLPAMAAAGAEPEKTADPFAAMTRALEEVVRHRYGRFLTAPQRREVAQIVGYRLRAGERLRRFPLKNSDEPAFVFQANVP